MKSFIRNLIPYFIIEKYSSYKRHRSQKQNSKKTIEEVFTEIYESNIWGGSKTEFCSGSGSTDELIVSAYILMIKEKATSEGFKGLTFVDLGCGDFRVGIQLLPLCTSYIGVDIVKPLISSNQKKYSNNTTHFELLNIVDDELPEGDVCFVRQVLQHLSNQQIIAILKKLKKYRWVFITEHYPTDNESININKDKVQGGDIRLYDNSGVYLSKPPFDIPIHALNIVLEVLGAIGKKKGNDPGIIRTFLYKPNF